MIRKSGMMSPDDETVIKTSRENQRYSLDSKASYDSEEIKDKVLVEDKFVPVAYNEEEGNNPFVMNLTQEKDESKGKQSPQDMNLNVSDMSSCWGVQVVNGNGQKVNQSVAS